jgi:hypothetical protein
LDHFTKLLRLFPHIVLAEPCFERRLDKRMYKDMKHDIRRVHFMVPPSDPHARTRTHPQSTHTRTCTPAHIGFSLVELWSRAHWWWSSEPHRGTNERVGLGVCTGSGDCKRAGWEVVVRPREACGMAGGFCLPNDVVHP